MDAQDASGAAARADARAEDGGTPQTGTEEANGANVADGKGVEFGAQPGAGDGGKTAHGATANWRVAPASEAADGLESGVCRRGAGTGGRHPLPRKGAPRGSRVR